MFHISFKDAPFLRNEEFVIVGMIEAPGFREDFWSPLGYWTQEQYEDQWRDAILTALTGRPSAIVTSMRNPKYARFINWWPLYPVEDEVRLQNQMLLLEHLKTPFNERDPYANVDPYTDVNSDGEALSEWKIPRPFLLDFSKSR